MHSIKIVICGTGTTPSNRGLSMMIYFNSNSASQPFLTDLFPCLSSLSTGITLSNTCSELYCLHILTPCLSLQHTSVLQAHCREHSDREFSSSQDTNLQYSYHIACTVTVTLKCSVLVTVTLLLIASLQW
jgi:hypothetical protein